MEEATAGPLRTRVCIIGSGPAAHTAAVYAALPSPPPPRDPRGSRLLRRVGGSAAEQADSVSRPSAQVGGDGGWSCCAWTAVSCGLGRGLGLHLAETCCTPWTRDACIIHWIGLRILTQYLIQGDRDAALASKGPVNILIQPEAPIRTIESPVLKDGDPFLLEMLH
ncbi:hypothetical protein QYE76_018371 [Lolium multiflorum]|uniref:Uncharacterized protein n=1 Tax=Lolium multiflorum TaxID=4521 RepID=A0AAD8VD48_LOLMU|nr:hypothetical protein QYE76_018371 [Lolium multiflorum]